MADGKGMFLGWFRVKMACIGATKNLSGTLLRGSHAIVWMGSKLQSWVRNCVGFHAIA